MNEELIKFFKKTPNNTYKHSRQNIEARGNEIPWVKLYQLSTKEGQIEFIQALKAYFDSMYLNSWVAHNTESLIIEALQRRILVDAYKSYLIDAAKLSKEKE